MTLRSIDNGQRPARAQQGERTYFWSNFPRKSTLTEMVEYAHRRHWIEQYHEEAKDGMGWDQYQGRRWDGFHRQALTIMLSFSFLVWYEWRERLRRKRPGPARGFFPLGEILVVVRSQRSTGT
jgi:SRSO17 transposase